MAFDPRSGLVACAGGQHELFTLDGQWQGGHGCTNFRCQFTPSGMLATRTQTGNYLVPPSISKYEVCGLTVFELSDIRAFLFDFQNDAETIFVSENGRLLQFQ